MKKLSWFSSAAGEGAGSGPLESRPWGAAPWPERIWRLAALVPCGLLLLLAALSICREAGALHPLCTAAMAAAVLLLALLTRQLAGESRLWLWALLAGAVGLRILFVLGWTVYPPGLYLSGWNLALELSRAGPGDWPALAAASGCLPMEIPHVLYMSLLIRLFDPSPLAIQLAGALWGGLSCLATARIGERLSGSRGIGLTAGVLLACCPTLLFSAGVLSWQPLYTLLLLAGLWLLLCRPLGRPMGNAAAAGALWALAQVLRPGLPIPLLGAALWLPVLLFRRTGAERRALAARAAYLLGAFLAVWLLAGLAVGGLTGVSPLEARLEARLAAGLNRETTGQLTEADLPLLTGEADAGPLLAQGLERPGTLPGHLLRKLRLQFGSWDYQWARMDRGNDLRNQIMDRAMHPSLQSYALALLLLALWGLAAVLRRGSREALLPPCLLLGALAAAVLLEADPVYSACLLPLLALWAAGPARKLAEWTLLLAAPRRGKKQAALPPALAAVRLVLTVVVYALMLALVLIFFTGNGVFIYEAF